jgi:hypothetical protein
MRLKGTGGGNALKDQGVDVAGAVFAALCVEADEVLEGRADSHHGLGEVEQAQHGLVPGHQLGGGVEHGNCLVEQVQPCQQQVVAPALFWRQ